MRSSQNFVLYTRELKSGVVYYAKFKRPDGKYGSGVNTGQTTTKSATSWCNAYIQRNGIENSTGFVVRQDKSLLKDYASGFFNWDGAWAMDKRASGKRISERQCIEKNSSLNTHIIPVLGNMKLLDIDSRVIKAFRNELLNTCSASTVNKTLQCLFAILIQAEEDELIKNAPRKVSASGPKKKRDILSDDEFERIFNIEWTDERGRLANILSAYTGMRASEIQALTIGDLNLSRNYLTVSKAWNLRMNCLNDTTKNGKARRVYLLPLVVREIEKFLVNHPRLNTPSEYLFLAAKIPNKPCEQIIFTRAFFKALEEIGISEEERKSRNIVFHSWRHFANTKRTSSGEFNVIEIQDEMGHSSEEMTLNYFHSDSVSVDAYLTKLERAYSRPLNKSIQ